MTNALEGRRILLTGASRGVGLASARALLQQGAQVLGIARDTGRLQQAAAELQGHGSFHPLAVELGAPGYVQHIAAEVERLWGALDVTIHNAGVMLHREHEICDEPEGILEDSLRINLLVPFHLTRSLCPYLLKAHEPRVLNVGSGAGTIDGMTEPGIASYRLSKWAVHGLTMLQAKEFAGRISVNAFDPGWIKTDLGGPQAPGTPEEAAAGLLATLALPWEETGKFFKDGKEIPW